MIGHGSANAAITVVNALFTGFGCAAGIALRAEAMIELSARRTGPGGCRIDPASDSPLTRAAVRTALGHFAEGRSFDSELSLRSEIPIAKGLKSSSAVGSAIVRAVADALDCSPNPETVAGLSAAAALAAGLSATGAFDDALAGVSGGVVVTDNRARRVLAKGRVPRGTNVLLWIPPMTHRPSVEWGERFTRESARGRRVVDLALSGRYEDALELNGELVERVMSYPYRPIRSRLRHAGARAVGVSGMGPTVAVISPADRSTVLESMLPAEGERRRVEWSDAPVRGAGPR